MVWLQGRLILQVHLQRLQAMQEGMVQQLVDMAPQQAVTVLLPEDMEHPQEDMGHQWADTEHLLEVMERHRLEVMGHQWVDTEPRLTKQQEN
jgi:hypothetical protein